MIEKKQVQIIDKGAETCLNLIGNIVVALNKSGNITLINKIGLSLLGYKRSGLLGKNWFNTCLPKDVSTDVKKVFKSIMLGEKKFIKDYENEVVDKKGNRKIISWHNTLIKDDQGAIVGILSSGEDVTERVRVKERLLKSEEKFRTFIESANDVIIFVDTKGVIKEANEQLMKISGYKKEDFIGKNIKTLTKIITKDSLSVLMKNFVQRLVGIESPVYVIDVITKKGGIRQFEVKGQLIKVDGKIVGDLVNLRDVTERLKIEDELKKIASIPKYSHEMINLADLDGRSIFLNEAGSKMIGINPKKHTDYHILDVMDKDYVQIVKEEVIPTLLKGGVWKGDLRYRHVKTGRIIDADVRAFAVKDEKTGKPLYLANISRDITEKKKMEKKVREMEEYLQLQIDLMPIGLIIWDDNLVVKAWNPTAESIFGFSEKEVLGKSAYKTITPESARDVVDKVWARLVKGGKTVHNENDNVRKDGTKIICSWLSTPLKKDGKVIGVMSMVQDITEKKESENILRKSEEKIRTIIESMGDGIFVIDRDNRITMFNEQAVEISGYSSKEVIGKRYDKFLKFYFEGTNKENKKFIKDCMFRDVITKMENHTELKRKNGSRVVVSDTASSFKDKDGKVVGAIVVFRDSTKEREIEKMKTEFVSTASHQLRTPLAGIKWSAEILLKEEDGKLNKEQKKIVERLYRSNKELVDLVDSLLDVSHIEAKRKFKIKKQKRDIIKIINRILSNKTLFNYKKKNISILKDKSFPKSLKIMVDGEKIEQVIRNLLDNAVKFSSKNSKINIGFDLDDKKKVIFYVKDGGIGIPRKQKNSIFEKFFRADNAERFQSGGSGLGLFIAKAIIVGHGGDIWFESSKDNGSTFYFLLPRK